MKDAPVAVNKSQSPLIEWCKVAMNKLLQCDLTVFRSLGRMQCLQGIGTGHWLRRHPDVKAATLSMASCPPAQLNNRACSVLGERASRQLSHSFASCQRAPALRAAAVEAEAPAWEDDVELQRAVAYTPGQAQSSLEAKAVGVLVGAMCGNALGAPVQNDRHWQIIRLFPYGLTEFPAVDLAQRPVKRGGVTGEFDLLLATARSLVTTQTCDAVHQAYEMSVYCDPAVRRYTPYADLLLQALRTGSTPVAVLPRLAAEYLAASEALSASTASDRHEREPFGPADYGAALRVPAVAVAYHSASQETLEAAVQELCLTSHAHPLGVDGARAIASAIHWLLAQPEGEATPEGLLSHLEGVVRTDDLKERLQLLRTNMFQIGEVRSWPVLFKSKEWNKLVAVSSRITMHDHATVGTEAAALALWVLITSWHHPRQAVSVAASLGGSTMVNAQLVGALAGALHGDAWIPASWFKHLENSYKPAAAAGSKQGMRSGSASSISLASSSSFSSMSTDEEAQGQEGPVLPLKGARDEVVFLAHELGKLGCSSVGLSQEWWAAQAAETGGAS